MTPLPLCQFRGDALTVTAPNSGAVRTVHECFHIHIRGREDVAQVSPVACLDCGFHDDAFNRASGYQQPAPHFPTLVEFSERFETCKTCPIREANFCPRAMGTCSLTRKLENRDFECPMGKFGRIERQ